MKPNIGFHCKSVCMLLSVLMLAGVMLGCGNDKPAVEEPAEPVTLIVAGAWTDCRALEAVGRKFKEKYPNCTVQYEYLQDYDAALLKRMSGENAVDLFFTNNIQADSALLPYAQEFLGSEGLDLSSTFDGLINNFMLFGEDTASQNKLYAIPLGAELRGLYINKTLLESLHIEVPTDQKSLLAACAVLKENGYIAFHGNPGSFAQTLLYPWVCNIIANAEDPAAAYEKVNTRAEGLDEMFREPFEFMYTLVENGYYDYKYAQDELKLFLSQTDEAYAMDFFNVSKNGEVMEKKDDVGQVAFMPSPLSLQNTMEKIKDDYHSQIEYVFVPAPVGPDGGFVYMSPARGIAANKDSTKLEWSLKFLNFLFVPENNTVFAEEFGVIPNTAKTFDYISTLFDIPSNRVSQLGQVTFGYDFYDVIRGALMDVSKGNNPKYMQKNEDGSVSLKPLSFYMANFREVIRGDEK